MHAFEPTNNNTSSRDNLTIMAPIDDDIAFLRASNDPNIAAVVRRFNINRSTLSKRFRGKTGSLAGRIEGRRLLTNKQEQGLVKQKQRLYEWRLPPAPAMVHT
jgi:AraC-like DNA-binding protein